RRKCIARPRREVVSKHEPRRQAIEQPAQNREQRGHVDATAWCKKHSFLQVRRDNRRRQPKSVLFDRRAPEPRRIPEFCAGPDTCTNPGMDLRSLAVGLMVAPAVLACSTPDRCVDKSCLPVTGEYTFVFDPPITCTSWESSKVTPEPLRIQTQADVLSI